jgi:hypothetical protein
VRVARVVEEEQVGARVRGVDRPGRSTPWTTLSESVIVIPRNPSEPRSSS